ncbi:hypothetical protein FIBSPDRAFT_239877 [Athelia psychrophila]|uniref:Uncharacterized protein n=1 Tax=Athelia psychrophila TaxID=1759441 RepID=A0A165YDC5_9AGAM|nr:hypothetical protein FIBSPDRAFT_239877 [Fibularhizoctonia sp. CBS 109695]
MPPRPLYMIQRPFELRDISDFANAPGHPIQFAFFPIHPCEGGTCFVSPYRPGEQLLTVLTPELALLVRSALSTRLLDLREQH